MKKVLSSILGLMVLTFVFNVVSPLSVSAQTQEELRMQYVMNPNTSVEEFRTEMKNYLTDLENALKHFQANPAVREQYNKNGVNPVAAIERAKADIDKIPAEDLEKMRAVYAKYPNWREAPQVIYEISQKAGNKTYIQRTKGRDITPDAITPDVCPNPNDVPSNTDIAATKAALIAAVAIREAFPTDGITIVARLPSIAVVAGLEASVLTVETLKAIHDDCTSLDASAVQTIIDNAKTEIINNDNSNKTDIVNNDNGNTTTLNTSITNAKNTIVSNDNTNKTAITTAITNAQTSINDNSTAGKTEIINNITSSKNEIISNDNSNKTTIINNDNSNTAALNTNLNNSRTAIITNDNTNATNIVNNDNTNRTQIINNDNANTTTLNTAITNAKNEILADANANKTELLRAHIEADLATESNGVKVAWYMTPTANGGKLDFVQQIVTETLANILAAGGSIGNAQSFLNKANADKAAGNFKSAYDNYRKAYKAAAN